MSFATDVETVAERVDERLTRTPWDLSAVDADEPQVSAATEVALFALKLSGKRRQARRAGRFSRLVLGFALAACVALASIACEKPDASPEATAQAISELPQDDGSTVTIGAASPRGSPAQFTDLALLDAGSDQQPWAMLAPHAPTDAPILVDRVGSGLDTVGGAYGLAAQPVMVGTRDGPSQFLDPLQPATQTGSTTSTVSAQQLTQKWGQDQRYLAATRAIAGQPSVLDAAYNAAQAAAAGGTHTYTDGVVLRVEPDQPVIQLIDKTLLESGQPTRAEDIVYVAIRPGERSLYEPGQVVNLRDVVMEKQNTDVDGQAATVYVANAALDGARVEMTGSTVNLEQLLQPRLQRVDQDLSAQQQVVADGTPQPAATGTPGTQPIIVNNNSGYRGPSFVDDFLIWMWLSNSGFYRGPTVIVNNPPSSPGPGRAATSTTRLRRRQAALRRRRSPRRRQPRGAPRSTRPAPRFRVNRQARVAAWQPPTSPRLRPPRAPARRRRKPPRPPAPWPSRRRARASALRRAVRRAPPVAAPAAPPPGHAAAPASRAAQVARASAARPASAARQAASVAKASAAAAAAPSASDAPAAVADALWSATANSDGRGLLLRGREFQPVGRDAFNPLIVDGVLRLARLAETAAGALRDSPDPRVRRAAAVLAARAHPVRIGLDD